MPIWVIILLISLCITTVTGIYTLRQNGRNGYRNGNGNGHTFSQMAKTTEQSLSGEPSSQEKKTLTLSVPKAMIVEEESPDETVTKWNQSKNKGALPDEEPHDHSEDHSPDPVLRERRRMLVRPREEEEEDGDDDEFQSELSAAPETLPASIEDQRQFNKVMTLEIGTQEEGQHDEDATNTLIVKKDAETQTTVFQEDKGVEAHPHMQDEEAQVSPVRENRTTQAMPSTQDIGTEEWLALQKSISVGNHIETEEKGVGEPLETKNREAQVSPDQEDKSLQESPQHHSIGTGEEQALQRSVGVGDPRETEEKATGETLMTQNKDTQIQPLQGDKSIQEKPEHESIGVGASRPGFHDRSLQVTPDAKDHDVQEKQEHSSIGVGTDEKAMRDQSLQIFPVCPLMRHVETNTQEEEPLPLTMGDFLRM